MKTTTNVFLGGLTTDMHPLTTPQLNLTDALNATLITFNGNELMLLNDMGNTRIQDSKTGNIMGLREGFIPVGMEEHGGIMYIASVNKEGKGLLGTIPSPVITYKQQSEIEGENIDFTWAKKNDESKVFMLYDDEVNPEEIFIVDIKEPPQKNGLQGQEQQISSLKEKHLYIPHLIAITSKGEKDITPQYALTGSDSWFNTSLQDLIDLESINNLIEQSDSGKTVNFLSYPKIQSGKLGVKFTKENIDEFKLGPNGKYAYTDITKAKCYPVLQYKEDENQVKHFYSVLYGVYYKTSSDVEVDWIKVRYRVEGNLYNEISYYVKPKAGQNKINKELLSTDSVGEYYLTTLKKNIGRLIWPGSDTSYPSYYIGEILIRPGTFGGNRAPSLGGSLLNEQVPLYEIYLDTNYNKWIDLKIEYYRDGWDNPLGIYEMTYNPYYMDKLGLFVTGKYWRIHKFSNNKSSFLLYRKYSNNVNPPDPRIGKKDGVGKQSLSVAKELFLELYNSVEFENDHDVPDPYKSLFSSVSNTWGVSVLGESKYEFPDKTNTTYLRQNPYLETVVSPGILSISIEFPISIKGKNVVKNMTNTAAMSSVINSYGEIEVSYIIKVGDILRASDTITFKPKVQDGPLYTGELFYRGTRKTGDEWHNVQIDFLSSIREKITFDSNSSPGNAFGVELIITSIKTKNLLHFTEGWDIKHDLTLCLDTPTVDAEFTEASYNVYVPYKSSSYVYPLIDAVVSILDENNNTKEYPACVIGNAWHPILIDYKNNLLTLSQLLIPTSTANTGYTSGGTEILASFNLDGIELYHESASAELTPDKYYLYVNNDKKYAVTIESGGDTNKKTFTEQNNSGKKSCIIHATEDYKSFSFTASNDGGFRSIGIYEIIGTITGVDESKVFSEISNNMKINDIPISECSKLTVYCYAEGQLSYNDVIVTYNFAENKYNIECSQSYELNPIPEYGYLSPIYVYEVDTNLTYKDESGNAVQLYDLLNNEIVFRQVDKSCHSYPIIIGSNTNGLYTHELSNPIRL